MISDKNPLIGITGPADTMAQCAQALLIVDLATGDPDGHQDEGMGYHLILTAVRNALEWEAEHFQERVKPRHQQANVAQLGSMD